MSKYDGTFKNEAGTYFIVIDSQNNKIGYGENENYANFEMLAVTEFLATADNKLSGSAESKLTITIGGSEYTCTKLPVDVWTELTVENIESEIAKYDGTFMGTGMIYSGDNKKMKMTAIFVFNAKDKQIGYDHAIKEEPIPDTDTIVQKNMIQTLTELKELYGTMSGNGKDRIKMIRDAGGPISKLILTRK